DLTIHRNCSGFLCIPVLQGYSIFVNEQYVSTFISKNLPNYSNLSNIFGLGVGLNYIYSSNFECLPFSVNAEYHFTPHWSVSVTFDYDFLTDNYLFIGPNLKFNVLSDFFIVPYISAGVGYYSLSWEEDEFYSYSYSYYDYYYDRYYYGYRDITKNRSGIGGHGGVGFRVSLLEDLFLEGSAHYYITAKDFLQIGTGFNYYFR
ncbi:MAG: hypothetical protein AB1349_06010, partial [Elusimicrobiota bacterium]